MKLSLFKFLFLLIFFNAYSQSPSEKLVGIWAGNLPISQSESILLLLTNDNSNYLLNIPSQTEEDLQMSFKKIDEDEFELSIFDIIMSCKYEKEIIKINYKQGEYRENFDMMKISENPSEIVRSQIKRDGDFKTKIFNIEDDHSITQVVFTTLDYNNSAPTFILIEGSNVDEELNAVYNDGFYGHNIMLALSNYLVANNYNTLRITSVNEKSPTPYTIDSKIKQYEKVIEFFKKEKKGNFIVLGHSEGGLITQLISDDDRLLGKIILSSPIDSSLNSILFQTKNRIEINNSIPKEIKEGILLFYSDFFTQLKKADLTQDLDLISNLITQNLKDYKYYNLSEHNYNVVLEEALKEFITPIYLNMFKKDNKLNKMDIVKPTLYVYGDRDYLVDSKANIKYLQTINNKNIYIKEFKSTSHQLQKCEICTLDESVFLKETVNEDILNYLLVWIKNLNK